jgi:hypothetical protein
MSWDDKAIYFSSQGENGLRVEKHELRVTIHVAGMVKAKV